MHLDGERRVPSFGRGFHCSVLSTSDTKLLYENPSVVSLFLLYVLDWKPYTPPNPHPLLDGWMDLASTVTFKGLNSGILSVKYQILLLNSYHE